MIDFLIALPTLIIFVIISLMIVNDIISRDK